MVADQGSVFAGEVARLARRNRESGRAEMVTSSGHRVVLTGLFGGRVEAIVIAAPGGAPGEEVRRADGWPLGKTEEVAAWLWGVMERNAAAARERAKLAGLLSVQLSTVPLVSSFGTRRESARYRLTPEQYAELRAVAERMSAENTID